MNQTRLNGAAASLLILTLILFPGIGLAGSPLTLSEALETALANNPGLNLASANVRSAEIRVASEESDFLPTVSAGLSAAEKYDNGYETVNYRTAQADVTARYNLYSGGVNTASLQSAQKELSAADLDYEQKRQSLFLEVATAYLDVLGSEEILTVMEEDLESARVLLEKIEAMFEAGSRPVTDLYQQQAAVKEAELSLLSARRDLEVSRLKLLTSLGLDEDPGFSVSDPVLKGNRKVQISMDIDELLKGAMANRSDIAAQKERIEAARERVTEAKSGNSVTADLTGSISSVYNSLNDETMWEQFSNDSLAASVGISLTLPLYDARQTQNAVRQAETELITKQTTLSQMKLEIREELGQAFEDYQTAEKSLEVSEARLQWAEKALESVKARYETGAANLVELNDARSEAIGSRYDVVNARYDCLTKALTTEFYQGNIESAIRMLLEGVEKS